MRKINESQRELLDKLREFYFGGHSIPHLSLVQRFPGREEDIVGWDIFVEEFQKYYALLDEVKDEMAHIELGNSYSPEEKKGQ